MKIVHLINVRWFNATAWYALRLAESGILKGDDTAIIGLTNSPIINEAKKLGIKTLEGPFTSNNPIDFYNNLISINKFLKNFECDALVCHRGEMFWLLALYQYFAKPDYKLIRVRGDVRPPTKDVFSRFFHNKCCSHLVTSAKFLENYFINGLHTKKEHIDTIYGGVNRNVFYEDIEKGNNIRSEFNFKKDDFVVGIIGRFDEVKGHKIFLRACGTAYKKGMTNLKVLLAGFPEGISVDEINSMIKENGLENIAVITGKRTDIQAIINSLDLGVISSLGSEAICRVAMEIMACNKPVISSNAGVLPEIIPAEYRYNNEDYESLANLILNKKGFIKVYDQIDFYNEFLHKTHLL